MLAPPPIRFSKKCKRCGLRYPRKDKQCLHCGNLTDTEIKEMLLQKNNDTIVESYKRAEAWAEKEQPALAGVGVAA